MPSLTLTWATLWLFGGVSEEDAREALRLAQHKLPIKTKIIAREQTSEGGEA